jgi:hypothetical protein
MGLYSVLSGLCGMEVDGGEVEFARDEEEDGFHGVEAGEPARLSFGGLEQSVDGFDEAVGLARSGPGDDAVEMGADHGCDLLHGLDLEAHDVDAPLSQHCGNDVELLAVEYIAQLLAIEPSAGGALGGELDEMAVSIPAPLWTGAMIGSTLSDRAVVSNEGKNRYVGSEGVSCTAGLAGFLGDSGRKFSGRPNGWERRKCRVGPGNFTPTHRFRT